MHKPRGHKGEQGKARKSNEKVLGDHRGELGKTRKSNKNAWGATRENKEKQNETINT